MVEPSVDFHPKLKLWKSVMNDLYGYIPEDQNSTVLTESTDVLEISDSDSDVSVVELESNVCNQANSDEIMVID